MLVANLDGQRVEASEAEKGPEYHCPNCEEIVILKKGRIITHHFAHKPPVSCRWGEGETRAHREAKLLFKEEFIRRGLRAEVEYEIASLPDDRRADVVVWSPKGQPFALELQHLPISYDNLEHRTQSYIHAGVRVIWIPFFRPKFWEQAETLYPNSEGEFLIEKFPARPLEKWVHGFNFGEIWLYDPGCYALWKGKLEPHVFYVEESSWFEPGGYENSAGGYWKTSKRWRELTLWGPYSLNQIVITARNRQAKEIGKHKYPGGKIGKFELKDS